MEHLTEISIIEDYLDPIGHVNNVKLMSFLEDARRQWYKKAGISYEEMRKMRVGTVILRMDIMFLKETFLGDTLKIITQPQKLGTKSFVFQQKIYNQMEELVLEATVTCVMLDTTIRKSMPVVDQIARHFS
ncbi:acyl-CoA thioesterase [Neobacillus cucumis]|uniref:acyl-CoA thioesterase n=1 Tax=Neobacillus cucumis TaxID=1740721 RepID=UPI0018DFCEBC|nr:acyl-CoA thioesterase [Neobacillus cucumis]MBI0579206.1 acyl-CoA thioesterase [Neobacillus cucumis]